MESQKFLHLKFFHSHFPCKNCFLWSRYRYGAGTGTVVGTGAGTGTVIKSYNTYFSATLTITNNKKKYRYLLSNWTKHKPGLLCLQGTVIINIKKKQFKMIFKFSHSFSFQIGSTSDTKSQCWESGSSGSVINWPVGSWVLIHNSELWNTTFLSKYPVLKKFCKSSSLFYNI